MFAGYRAPSFTVGLVRRLVSLWFTASVGLFATSWGQSAPEPTLVTSYAEYWQLSAEARTRINRFQFEATVYYYDALWNQFWGENAGITFFFIPPPGQPLPLQRSGQRVRLTGEVNPAQGLNRPTKLTAEVLGTVELPVIPAQGRLHDLAALNERLVEIEGLIERQTETDNNHLVLDFISEGRATTATVWVDATEPLPQLAGSYARLRGLYIGQQTSDGRVHQIELWVPSKRQLTVIGRLDTDPRWAVAPTPLEHFAQATDLIHVVGKVVSTDQSTITLRDATGQATLQTGQTLRPAVGTEVEAFGRPVTIGLEQVVQQAIWRRPQGAVVPTTGLLNKYRLAQQVLELPPAEAARAQPVQLSGVVTWSSPSARFFFLQDTSGGIRVDWHDVTLTPPPPGRGAMVVGQSAMGDFAPRVVATRVTDYRAMSHPEPRRVTLEQALTGAEEARWIELRGYLQAVEADGPWTLLHLATATGDCVALVPATPTLAQQVGAIVRVRGVCQAVSDDRRRLTSIQIWVPALEEVQIDQPAPADPFAVPLTTLIGLRQYGPLQSMEQRVRVQGVVTQHLPGRSVHIQDGDEGLQAFGLQTTPLPLGTQVEIVGLPGRQGNRLVLRNAVYRTLAPGQEPAPVILTTLAPVDNQLEGRLVRYTGILRGTSTLRQQQLLALGAPQTTTDLVTAHLDTGTGRLLPAAWKPSSLVQVTGLYRGQPDEDSGIDIILRSPQDVVVLQGPSYWTLGSALSLAGLFAACTAGVLGWVLALRHRVQAQTRQLREQYEQQTRLQAELARNQRLHSLGALAGGIAHDFNNQLMVVLGNLNLAQLDPQVAALAGSYLTEAEQSVQRARDLTQQLLTFARGGDPRRESVALPTLVEDAAGMALTGTPVRHTLQTPADIWPVHADRRQLSSALQSLLHQARRVTPAGETIRLTLSNQLLDAATQLPLAPGRYVYLQIQDAGPAIPPERLASFFDPYFASKNGGLGLASAYSVVQRHQGHITVEASPAGGNVFHIWLPAADTLPTPPLVAAAPATPAPATPAAPAPNSHRVLVMDDEPGIRRVVQLLLRRQGVDTTLTCDGDACVRAYQEALASGQPFDLVILDLTVPNGMGGKDTIAELRKLDPHVRAIVSSGYSDDPILANPHEYGFAAVVPKPYETVVLAETVRRLLAEPR